MNSLDQLLGIKGCQCALTLAQHDSSIALIDRNREELEMTRSMILAENPDAFTEIINTDISSVDNCDQPY